jgi:hypothetical protein
MTVQNISTCFTASRKSWKPTDLTAMSVKHFQNTALILNDLMRNEIDDGVMKWLQILIPQSLMMCKVIIPYRNGSEHFSEKQG